MPINSYEIYSGFDQSASTVNVESLTVSGDTALTSLGQVGRLYLLSSALSTTASYFILSSKPRYEKRRVINANGGQSVIGYPTHEWVQPFMTVKAYEYLQTNYLENSTNRNLVTIRTAIGTASYAKYNALFTLPPLSEFTFEDGSLQQLDTGVQVLINVVWSFRIQGTAS